MATKAENEFELSQTRPITSQLHKNLFYSKHDLISIQTFFNSSLTSLKFANNSIQPVCSNHII